MPDTPPAPASLAAAFVAEGARADATPALGERLVELVLAAQAAHPGIPLDAGRFARHLARHCPGDAPIDGWLGRSAPATYTSPARRRPGAGRDRGAGLAVPRAGRRLPRRDAPDGGVRRGRGAGGARAAARRRAGEPAADRRVRRARRPRGLAPGHHGAPRDRRPAQDDGEARRRRSRGRARGGRGRAGGPGARPAQAALRGRPQRRAARGRGGADERPAEPLAHALRGRDDARLDRGGARRAPGDRGALDRGGAGRRSSRARSVSSG